MITLNMKCKRCFKWRIVKQIHLFNICLKFLQLFFEILLFVYVDICCREILNSCIQYFSCFLWRITWNNNIVTCSLFLLKKKIVFFRMILFYLGTPFSFEFYFCCFETIVIPQCNNILSWLPIDLVKDKKRMRRPVVTWLDSNSNFPCFI